MMRPKLRHLLSWLLVILLSLALPVQALTTTIAELLGPRHLHAEKTAELRPSDSMANWQDFRRAQYEPVINVKAVAHATSHAHSHASGERHHHDVGDLGIVNLEPSPENEGAAAETFIATAGSVFLAVGEQAPLAEPSEAVGSVWGAAAAVPSASPDPRRIERPPQRLG